MTYSIPRKILLFQLGIGCIDVKGGIGKITLMEEEEEAAIMRCEWF